MKKVVFLSMALAVSTVLFAQQPKVMVRGAVIMEQAAPTPSEAQAMKTEEEKHPRIVAAIHNLHDALSYLQQAPDDFGGNKAQAIADTKQAIISLRKALYYRINADGMR